MKLLDILTAPWAIQPAKLLEIQAIYATHLRGEKIDLAGVEQRLGRPLKNEPMGYDIVDGVAVLPVVGVSAKRANLMMQVSGGVSTEILAREIRAAAADESVHSIILRIDSPGGTVDGTQTLAQLVREVGQTKPVVSLAGGLMASAAYWYGSAASAIYIEDATTQVGSIGVVATHTDVSAAEAADGYKTTEIVAGKYKRIASNYAPLSKEGRATMQGQVDAIYAVFLDAVAAHRGVSAEQVHEQMADGRLFMGDAAIAAGLVDGVATLEQLVAQLNRDRRAGSAHAARVNVTGQRAPAAFAPPPKGTAPMLTREKIEAEAPDIVKAIQAEASAAGAATGATAERERIQAVMSQSMPGHDALVTALAFDGKTTGPEAAVAVLNAERKSRSAAAANLAADAPQPLTPAATPALPAVDASEDESLPLEERCKARFERDPSVRAEFVTLASYTAYCRADEQGRARRLTKS